MKVLQVISSTNIGSGIANVVMNYYRNIDRKQVQFDFLIFWEAPVNYNKEIESLGGRVYYFTKPGLTTYFKAKKELRNFFAEHKGEYDIVHCHEILVAKPVFEAARKQGDVKVCISHSHNSRLADSFVKKVRNRIAVLGLAKKSDYCFACSSQAAISAFGKSITKNKKYHYITNAINFERFQFSEEGRVKVRKEFGITHEKILCNVGRLSLQKNQSYLLKILAGLVKRDENIRLLLVGDGELRKDLENIVIKNALEKYVIFTASRRDIGDILSASDVFVFPSLYEGLGLVLIEAQINGLKCVANETLPKEAFINDNVIGLKLNDIETWINTIYNVLKKGYDREEIILNTTNSGFSIGKVIKSIETIYKKIVD